MAGGKSVAVYNVCARCVCFHEEGWEERKWNNGREKSGTIKDRKLISLSYLTECSFGCCFHCCWGRLLMIMPSSCLSGIEVFTKAGKNKKFLSFSAIVYAARLLLLHLFMCKRDNMRFSARFFKKNWWFNEHHYLLWCSI